MKLRDEPCTRCGWKYLGFHVCVDLSKPEPVLPRARRKTRRSNGRSDRSGPRRGSAEWREAIREGMKEHAEKLLHDSRERDDKIVKLYSEPDATIRGVAAEMQLNHQTVRNALLRAQAEGRIEIRKPAHLRNRE